MPRISQFFGIVIAMYYNDHNPPHSHVLYAGSETIVAIDTPDVVSGSIPPSGTRPHP